MRRAECHQVSHFFSVVRVRRARKRRPALRLARAEGEKGVVQAIRDAVKRRKEKALAKKEQRTRCVLDRI